MDIDKLYILFLAQSQKITTDTRNIEKGQIFFALKGDKFNGNKFALDALKQGARYAVVDDPSLSKEKNIILVDNVLETLQQLALYHRQRLNIPIIAITGSNGKTTTKELIKCVLAKKFKVAYTKGNLNNHIGIPLTILAIKAYEDISIVEMGANHQGEIAAYCTYTEPNFGYITNIGKAHLEGFGGIEGVEKGKTELFQYLRNTNGRVFVNEDDIKIIRNCEGIQKISFGANQPIHGESIRSENGFLNLQITEYDIFNIVRTQLTGEYNIPNILAAYTIGRYFEIPIEDVIHAIEEYVPSNSRSQIIQKETHTVILDAYNANPSSMEVALRNIANFSGRKVAILGAMKELGDYTAEEHLRILNLAISLEINEIIAVGREFQLSASLENVKYIDTTDKAKKWYRSQVWDGETILIKGSRGMALEKILEST